MKNDRMTIARLGAAAGVGVETVRYYQRRGLLAGAGQRRRGAALRARATFAGCSSSAAPRRPASRWRRSANCWRSTAPTTAPGSANWPASASPRSTPASPSSKLPRRARAPARDLRLGAQGALPDPGGVRRHRLETTGAASDWRIRRAGSAPAKGMNDGGNEGRRMPVRRDPLSGGRASRSRGPCAIAGPVAALAGGGTVAWGGVPGRRCRADQRRDQRI